MLSNKTVMAGLTRLPAEAKAQAGHLQLLWQQEISNIPYMPLAFVDGGSGPAMTNGYEAEKKNKKTSFATTNYNKILCKFYKNQCFVILQQNRKNGSGFTGFKDLQDLKNMRKPALAKQALRKSMEWSGRIENDA